MHFCNFNSVGGMAKRIMVQCWPWVNRRPYLKNNKAKMAGGMAQEIEYLPSKHKVLSSISHITHTHTHTHTHKTQNKRQNHFGKLCNVSII
jgi:hypothetical protein